MSSPQALLRKAAEDFAQRIYEIVHAEVVNEIKAQLALSAAAADRGSAGPAIRSVIAYVEQRPGATPKHATTSDQKHETKVGKARAGAWHDTAEALVTFVNTHPGCRYSEIVNAVPASSAVLKRALRDAKESGAIRMEGVRIKARYYPEAPVDESVRALQAGAQVDAPLAPISSTLSEKQRKHAESILTELDESLSDDMHTIRLGGVLQAIVAQVRQLQERVDPVDPMAARLDRAIRRITAVRAAKELPFLVGLKRGATADWDSLARRARARVDAYDRDTEEIPKDRPSRPSARRAERAKTSEKASEQAESFPALQRTAATLPLVLVGGIKKNEVLSQIELRYGVSVEWVAAQGANARAVDAFVARVKHGKLGAVVILEGLFGHSQVIPIVQALKSHEVPFAYGDRAGTESLRRAFAELESALATTDAARLTPVS